MCTVALTGMEEGKLDKDKIPRHVAIIMDGNGRWAKRKGLLRSLGHENGVDALRRIATASAEIGISYLTVYAFSAENWSRPKSEVNALMKLLISSLRSEVGTLMKNNIRLHAIGQISTLPAKCIRELKEVMEMTAGNDRMTLNLALSYSSRTEILEGVKNILRDVKNGKVKAEDIDEKLFDSYLYTRDMPDPELLIRTSGEYRISNYLLWQIAYSELYFSDKLWPDFEREDLYKALYEYQQRERRFGKISEQLNS